jgi:PPOX class probable F420-dependent enzyme
VTLSGPEQALIDEARRATLATVARDGLPRLVPICFVLMDDVLWSPLDEKPKSVADVRSLARVRDILERPEVAIMVDHWSEDWTELGWLRLRGTARLVEPANVPAPVIAALRAKYPQYRDHDLEHRPALQVGIETVARWSALADPLAEA